MYYLYQKLPTPNKVGGFNIHFKNSYTIKVFASDIELNTKERVEKQHGELLNMIEQYERQLVADATKAFY
jgi:hypothetical protein